MSPLRNMSLDTVLLLLILFIPSSFQLPPPAIPIGSFYITLVELCLFVLFFRWLLDAVVTRKVYPSSFDKGFLLLLGYFGASLLIGLSRHESFKVLADFRQFLPLFLYFWAIRAFGTRSDLGTVRRGVFNVTLLVAGYVLFAFLFLRGMLATSDARMAHRVFFDNTLLILMAYGGYLLGRAMLAAKGRAGVFLLLGLNALMLLVMQVRTYWVAFAFALAAEAVRYRFAFLRSRVFLVSAYFAVLIASSGLLFLEIAPDAAPGLQSALSSITERANSLVNLKETLFGWQEAKAGDTETISTRAVTAETIWNDYVLKAPLFGTGFGGELPLMSPYGGVVLMKYQVDNGFLTLLAKFGVVGCAIYGIIIVHLLTALVAVAKSPYATSDQKMLARSFLFGILAMLVASVFSSIFVRQQPILVGFLFLVAEVVVMQRNVRLQKLNSNTQGHV